MSSAYFLNAFDNSVYTTYDIINGRFTEVLYIFWCLALKAKLVAVLISLLHLSLTYNALNKIYLGMNTI